MLAYTVHEPPEPPSDVLDRGERLVLVKDGFSWTAAFLTPVWMLAHRMWLVLVGYLIVVGVLVYVLPELGLSNAVSRLIAYGLGIFIGFEADTLRRWTLDRRGYRMLGTVTGKNSAECERRFFDAWLPDQLRTRAYEQRHAGVVGSLAGRHYDPAPVRSTFLGGLFARKSNAD